ncbi:MAG: hypothetical protein NZ870_03670 [bacterium]|nr:hypothetical protein [bacterium]
MFFLLFSILFADIYDDIKNQLKTMLNDFSKDVAGIVSVTNFHSGTSLGFPGVDFGIHLGSKKPNSSIFPSTVSFIGAPVLQLEVGLPARFKLTGKYFSIDKVSLTGVGITYTLLKLVKPLPEVNASIFHTMLSHTEVFDLSDTSIAISAGINFPIIKPYVVIAYDMINSKTKFLPQNVDSNTTLTRFQAGFSFSFIPFTYLNLGAAFDYGTIYQFGLGAKF